MAGSKALLKAQVLGTFPTLRGSGGHTDTLTTGSVIVKSNTKWIVSTTATWIHLNSTSEVYGDGAIRFSYDSYLPAVILSRRTGIISIKTPSGIILNTIYVSQHDSRSSLRFSTNAAGSVVQPDILTDHTSKVHSMYVYNSENTGWNIYKNTTVGNTWCNANILTGNGTTAIQISIDASDELKSREAIFYLMPEGSNTEVDVLIVKQTPDDSTSIITLASGGLGDWNVNMHHTKVKLKEHTYAGADTTVSYNPEKERSIRYSSGVKTVGEIYTINHTDGVLVNTNVDPGNNSFANYWDEKNETSDDFSKEYNYGNWNLEAEMYHVGVLVPTTLDSKPLGSSFSRFLLEKGDAHSKKMSFTSTVPLIPDDAFGDDWDLKGYTGTGICTVSLHNIFDYDETDATKTIPQWNYDTFSAGKDAENVVKPITWGGNFNASTAENITVNSYNKVSFMKEWNFWHNYIIWGYMAAQKSGSNPTTVKVMANIIPTEEEMEIEDPATGKKSIKITYTYSIESIGYFNDGPSSVPVDTIHGLQTRMKRHRNATNEVMHLYFNVRFMNQTPSDSDDIGPDFRLHLRMDYDRKLGFERFLAVIKITIYIVAALALFVVSVFFTGGAAIWAWLSGIAWISSMLILVIEVVDAIIDDVKSRRRNLERRLNSAGVVVYGQMVAKMSNYSANAGKANIAWPNFMTHSAKGSSGVAFTAAGRIVGVTAAIGYAVTAINLIKAFPQELVPDDTQKYVAGVLITPIFSKV